ncbi:MULTISPECIES: hypothetical protein [Leptolyngbya]|uniref:Uncharacterized protein n=1 Tax=Leptolyngbya boryana CZ1 TaxID=3060204 RepID=A0AA96WSX7_LEPBY|nr:MULTISPECIES: hypothetical protein [Leptolyngbya]MCY6492794.1 hypothetical protein [Leptolyngbya sp. GGD]WNZ45141.1 hypothetical protein Q2T42_25470 [Leptolyngbya boryana CZ1]
MNCSKLNIIGFAIVLSSFALSFPAQTCPSASKSTSVQASARQPQTIVDIAASNPNFSTLVEAVKAAGLVKTLSEQT